MNDKLLEDAPPHEGLEAENAAVSGRRPAPQD